MSFFPVPLLSVELILAICEELDVCDLKQLRLSCKFFARILYPLVLRNLFIPTRTETLKETVSYLQGLTQSGSALTLSTKNLTIGYSQSIPSYPTLSSHNHINDEDEILRNDFLEALSLLKAVSTVSWSTSYQDAIWLQKTLWNTIRTLPNLRHLVLNLNFIKAQHLINLDLLTELESIIILNPIYPADWLFLNLATLLASSSKLTSLTIDMAHRYYPPYTMSESLHQLFQYSSDKHLPPRLRHLGLDYCLVLLDEVALHNLSHLTSFKLLHTQYEDLDPSCSEVASSPDDIWSAFTGSGIRLQELEHDTVTDSLLDYLLTFSGLKKLSLIGLGDNEQNLSDTPAYARFCTFVLPNHQETLEELNLTPYFDCRWCFGSHNAYVIAKCTKLKHISMSVISSQVGKTTSGQSKLHEEDVVKLLIDTVISHSPGIRFIGVSPAIPEFLMVGTSAQMHFRDTQMAIFKSIEKFSPPVSCWHRPIVTLDLCNEDQALLRLSEEQPMVID